MGAGSGGSGGRCSRVCGMGHRLSNDAHGPLLLLFLFLIQRNPCHNVGGLLQLGMRNAVFSRKRCSHPREGGSWEDAPLLLAPRPPQCLRNTQTAGHPPGTRARPLAVDADRPARGDGPRPAGGGPARTQVSPRRVESGVSSLVYFYAHGLFVWTENAVRSRRNVCDVCSAGIKQPLHVFCSKWGWKYQTC